MCRWVRPNSTVSLHISHLDICISTNFSRFVHMIVTNVNVADLKSRSVKQTRVAIFLMFASLVMVIISFRVPWTTYTLQGVTFKAMPIGIFVGGTKVQILDSATHDGISWTAAVLGLHIVFNLFAIFCLATRIRLGDIIEDYVVQYFQPPRPFRHLSHRLAYGRWIEAFCTLSNWCSLASLIIWAAAVKDRIQAKVVPHASTHVAAGFFLAIACLFATVFAQVAEQFNQKRQLKQLGQFYQAYNTASQYAQLATSGSAVGNAGVAATYIHPAPDVDVINLPAQQQHQQPAQPKPAPQYHYAPPQPVSGSVPSPFAGLSQQPASVTQPPPYSDFNAYASHTTQPPQPPAYQGQYQPPQSHPQYTAPGYQY